MDDAKKQEIVDRLGAADTLSQVVQEGVDVVNRYLKTEHLREVLAVADDENLEIVMLGLDRPIVLRLREREG